MRLNKRIKMYLAVVVICMGTANLTAQVPMPPKPGTTNTKVVDNARINTQLQIINSAFETYNSYKTKFRVEGQRLIWKNEFTEVSGNLKDLIFYASYEDNWLAIKCKDGDCMQGTSYPEEYSMALRTESGKTAPVIEEVINALNLIKEEVLRN